MTELEATHFQMRGIGSQDFECYSLFLGLCALNKKDRAVHLLREHVEQRQVKWPLPRTILTAVEYEVQDPQAHRSGRTLGLKLQDTAALSTDPLSGVL